VATQHCRRHPSRKTLERHLSSPNPRRDGGPSSPNPVQPAMIHDDRDGSQSSLNLAQSSTIRGGGAEDEDLHQYVVQRSLNPAHSSMIHGGRPENYAVIQLFHYIPLGHFLKQVGIISHACSCSTLAAFVFIAPASCMLLCTFISCILHAPAGRMGSRRVGVAATSIDGAVPPYDTQF
jgi:hypothetical protein